MGEDKDFYNLDKTTPLIQDLYRKFVIGGDLFRDNELILVLGELAARLDSNKPLYQRWTQQDRNGKERRLSVPNRPLKRFIDMFLLQFIKTRKAHEKSHGGERGWSVKRSLEMHLPCSCAFSFDLESAFQNIPEAGVYEFFMEIIPECEQREEACRLFSFLATVNYNGNRGLPQGSPLSIALFNRILYELDERLDCGARQRELRYSRWVDDMTISSPQPQQIENLLGAVELTSLYFPVSKEKIFFQNGDRIYLLGHRIERDRVTKNSKEEKNAYKAPPLNFDEFFSGHYKSWL